MTVETTAKDTSDGQTEPTAAKDAGPDDTAERPIRSLLPKIGSVRFLAVAVLLALAAATVTAVLQWRESGQLSDRESTRQEIKTRAGAFGQALLSYDHRNLRSARDQVMGMATGDFAKTYDTAFTGGLEGIIAKLQADAKATVRDVYLTDMDSGRAKAVVVVDSEVRSTAGTRRVIGSYLQMELIRQKRDWRINQVSAIGTTDEALTKPDTKTPRPGVSPSPKE